MPGLTDARVEELNESLAVDIPRMRAIIDRLESVSDLAQGHAAVAALLSYATRVNYNFTEARMPAFARISV